MKPAEHSNNTHRPTFTLRELPALPVVSTTYCSQDVVDGCIKYLEANAPGPMRRLHELAATKLPTDFTEVLGNVLAKDHVNLPTDFLARVALAFEISRRFERAYGFKGVIDRRLAPEATPDAPVYENVFFVVKGRPLADSPEGPLPPLPPIPKILNTHRRIPKYGLTQEMADRLLPKIYSEHGRLWFEIAEMLRRSQQVPGPEIELRKHASVMFEAEFPERIVDHTVTLPLEDLLVHEAKHLIPLMCGLYVKER
jgi:hypothetical protein